MIDHVSLPVCDLARAGAFYDAVLAPLGMVRIADRPATIGYGKRHPELWLNLRTAVTPIPHSGAHVALRARDGDAVRAFHAAALVHGGADDGAPGPRAAAMTSYFGAFAIDPDGNRIEVLTFPPAG